MYIEYSNIKSPINVKATLLQAQLHRAKLLISGEPEKHVKVEVTVLLTEPSGLIIEMDGGK
jgi:hypothetical protein